MELDQEGYISDLNASGSSFTEVIDILKVTEVKIDNQTWNRRYREYMEKIKNDKLGAANILQILDYIEAVLGIKLHTEDITDTQKSLIKDREQARKSNDWSRSDAIRDELKKQGLELNDTQDGVTWKHF